MHYLGEGDHVNGADGQIHNLNDAFQAAIAAYMEGVRICLPGVVTKYDAGKRRANIQPSIKRVFADGGTASIPEVTSVPVIWPSGGGGGVSFPLVKGDGVLLVFGERNLEEWASGKGGEALPLDGRKFDLSDAIAIPGLYPFGVDSGFPGDAAVFQFQGMKMRMKGGRVAIGNAGAEVLDLLDSTMAELKSLAEACQSYGVPGSGAVVGAVAILEGKMSGIKGTL